MSAFAWLKDLFKKFSRLGISEKFSQAEIIRARFITFLYPLASVVAILLLFISVFVHMSFLSAIYHLLFLIGFTGIFFYFVRSKNLKVASFLSSSITFAVETFLIFQGGFTGYGFLWFLLVPFVIYSINGVRLGNRWMSFLTAEYVLLWFIVRLNYIPFPYGDAVILEALAVFVFMEFLALFSHSLLEGTLLDLSKYKLAVDNASDHIMITDPDAHILYANKAAEKITGYTFAEMEGKTPALWGGNMPKSFYEKMWKKIKGDREAFTGEVANRRKNGESYPATLGISPIVDQGKIKYFVGVEKDISKEKQIDKMKTEFVSLTSHQLRSPLTIIKWSIESLEKDLPKSLSDNQKKLIKNIYDSNQIMIDLVNALLDVSRLEMGRMKIEPKLTNLKHLAKEAVEQMEEILQLKHTHLTIKTIGSIPEIKIDPDLILNVFLSILNNAVKYTAKGGHVSILIKKDGDDVITEVTDDGLGIPKADQSHIFERFFRASNVIGAGGGTGLGLYLAKQIIEASEGKIWFESTEGKGSVFSFSLPVTGSKAVEGEIRMETGQAI